jgi:hypothetical protein
MPERDYSHFINNPSPLQDKRPFWLRLLSSIKFKFSFSNKKPLNDVADVVDGIKINIKGGADF